MAGLIAWHLRVGDPCRALPAGDPHGRAVYGWVRRWGEKGLFGTLMRYTWPDGGAGREADSTTRAWPL